MESTEESELVHLHNFGRRNRLEVCCRIDFGTEIDRRQCRLSKMTKPTIVCLENEIRKLESLLHGVTENVITVMKINPIDKSQISLSYLMYISVHTLIIISKLLYSVFYVPKRLH
jgi:hypothetical protein